MAKDIKAEPLNRANFGLALHRYQTYDATVNPLLTDKQLESGDLWVHVAPQMRCGDEVRVRAEDDSFVGLLHVTYAVGNTVRLKMVYRTKMEAVDHELLEKEGPYSIKQRGPKKWCIIKNDTGDIIKELIPTQVQAVKELDDYNRALAA